MKDATELACTYDDNNNDDYCDYENNYDDLWMLTMRMMMLTIQNFYLNINVSCMYIHVRI